MDNLDSMNLYLPLFQFVLIVIGLLLRLRETEMREMQRKSDINLVMNKISDVNNNYMSIAVSVLTRSCVARNYSGAARQESNPQSATAYSSGR